MFTTCCTFIYIHNVLALIDSHIYIEVTTVLILYTIDTVFWYCVVFFEILFGMH